MVVLNKCDKHKQYYSIRKVGAQKGIVTVFKIPTFIFFTFMKDGTH